MINMSRGIGGYMNLIAADDTILMRFFKDFKVLDREQLHCCDVTAK